MQFDGPLYYYHASPTGQVKKSYLCSSKYTTNALRRNEHHTIVEEFPILGKTKEKQFYNYELGGSLVGCELRVVNGAIKMHFLAPFGLLSSFTDAKKNDTLLREINGRHSSLVHSRRA